MPDLAGKERRLSEGMAALGVVSSPAQRRLLVNYLELLLRWNTAFNLTSVRDPLQMVPRHLLDSLSLLAFLPEGPFRAIDVGTGAGLPGVPLAILRPDAHFDLLDSNSKKTRFLFQVKTALGLANMAVRHERVESCHPDRPFDRVLTRAFASLVDMVDCSAHLCAPGGRLLAMKGQLPSSELAEIQASGSSISVVAVHRLEVPGLAEERHLVELQIDQSAL